MNEETHKKRHQELHEKFDELFTDFILHANGRTTSTILELINWSYAQTQKPDHKDNGG